MTDEMIATMAKDLNIHPFACESRPQFINRLIYSAMACWIKTTALDRSVSIAPNQNQRTGQQHIAGSNQGTSRRHILDRCDNVLAEMLYMFPASEPWFKTDPGNGSAVSLLRSRLIHHGDLLNVGFQTKLTLAPESITPLNSDLECGKGYLLNPSFSYSGIAMLRRRKSEYLFEGSVPVDSCEWLRDYIKSAWWKPVGHMENVEYFNPFLKAKSNYRCWQDALPTQAEGIVLARYTNNALPAEYLLVKTGENNKIHRIDSFLRETGEYRRFQFALRKIVGNELVADSRIYRDHIHLTLNYYLPERENRLLESFAWPCSSVSDKLEWDMVLSIWPHVKIHLEKLGIAVREETEDG